MPSFIFQKADWFYASQLFSPVGWENHYLKEIHSFLKGEEKVAKKEGTPTLTAERVWRAVRDGSLVVKPIPGTRMLQVVRGRIRLTWGKEGKKDHAQIRLSSIYLNPRWIPLPDNYPTEKLEGLDDRKRAAKGVVRVEDGSFRLLIYQQLDNLFSLLRQIEKHISPQYGEEEDELWGLFGRVDSREALGLTASPHKLQEVVLGRRKATGSRSEVGSLPLSEVIVDLSGNRISEARAHLQKASSHLKWPEEGPPPS